MLTCDLNKSVFNFWVKLYYSHNMCNGWHLDLWPQMTFEVRVMSVKFISRTTEFNSLEEDIIINILFWGVNYSASRFPVTLQITIREDFLRKNIVAVSFFQNGAIHPYS